MARTASPPLNRRGVLAAAGAALAAQALPALAAPSPAFVVSGRPQQGGFLIGRTAPGARVAVDGKAVGEASAGGLFLIGLDRDQGPSVQISVDREGAWESRDFAIAPGAFDIQRIDGLPAEQVTPTAPELLARIQREAALKAEAFASLDPSDGFRDGFAWPVQATRTSSSFGGQRILNGRAGRPHYGVDLAAPEGAPILAPAPGLVVLAEPDMHFEGGMTFIDHGQGVVAMFLHQSKLLVRAGERVERSQPIGAVGKTGRATGPHLCWRLKWRDRNLDPSLLVGAQAPTGGVDSLPINAA